MGGICHRGGRERRYEEFFLLRVRGGKTIAPLFSGLKPRGGGGAV